MQLNKSTLKILKLRLTFFYSLPFEVASLILGMSNICMLLTKKTSAISNSHPRKALILSFKIFTEKKRINELLLLIINCEDHFGETNILLAAWKEECLS